MTEGFKNPYENVKVELGEMNEGGLNMNAPTPEALEEMFGGIGKIMSTTEQSTQSEGEIRRENVKTFTDSIAKLENIDALENYLKLRDKLIEMADIGTLAYYSELLQARVDFLTDQPDSDPKRKIILKLKGIIMDVDMQVKMLKIERTADESSVASGKINSAIENL